MTTVLSDFGALFSVVLKLFLFTAVVDIIAWVVWELFLGE